MKRGQIKRWAQLKREKRLRARRPTPRRSERVRDPSWLAAVAELYCCLWARQGCEGPIEVNHVGRRAFGRKCNDRETAPFCRRHHRDWTEYRGLFADRTKEWRRGFADWAIAWTAARLERYQEGRIL